jgi:hypothetical protein
MSLKWGSLGKILAASENETARIGAGGEHAGRPGNRDHRRLGYRDREWGGSTKSSD